MSRLSTIACSTRMPALNVRSITAPGADVRQLGAHEGPALARLHVLELDDGEQAVVELQGDAVLQVVGGDGRHGEVLREVREGAAAVLGDEHRVLDPDAAEPGTVDAGLHGHHVPDLESRPWRPATANGSSWMSRPTPWPVPWVKSARPAGLGDQVAAGRVDGVGGDAGPDGRTPAAWAAVTTSSSRRCVGARLPDDERAGHVGVVAVDQRAEVDDDEIALDDRGAGRGGGGAWPTFGPLATMVSKLGPARRGDASSVSSARRELGLGALVDERGRRRFERGVGRYGAASVRRGHLAGVLHRRAASTSPAVATSSAWAKRLRR